MLPYLREPNIEFLRNAITKTTLLLNSRRAHSTGFILLLNKYHKTNLPNPTYSAVNEAELFQAQASDELQAKKLSMSELEKRVRSIQHSRTLFIEVMQRQYLRNPFIAEYARRMANGICADCGNPAPFRVKGTNEPFLEVHHILSLADKGEDTIENVVALCPNCHRKRHFG
jgi:predicted restriction endonuclease